MPRARLVDVATEAGVSTATASLVLRGLSGPSVASQEAVRAAAARLGYRPDRAASLLARQRTRLLGVLLDVTSPFHAELVVALDAAAGERGFDLLLATTTPRRRDQAAVETLLDSRCEALVLFGPSELSVRAIDRLAQACPTYVLGRAATRRASGIRADDERGLGMAVDHLVGLGHRRIAFVDGPRGPIAMTRRRGYERAMRRHGLADSVLVVAGGTTEVEGSAAPAHVLAAGPGGGVPTAVVTFNDRVAVGLVDALERAGLRVPSDVSVVGYDDSPLARLAHIDLTTVSQEPAALAAAVVGAAAARLDDPDTVSAAPPPVDVVIAPRLVVRTSSARPPTSPA